MDRFAHYEEGIPSDRKNQKKIKGIVCDVKNCVWHDGISHCTAGQIAIGPSYATSCTDTVCATFRQKML